ncbi:MAG: hypothetical protein K0S46_1851 [Moraxellaceae bacterium]|jgi:hypothetical protein|nr:hypothetical protein [Moraxellaceae bacterium]
MQDKRTQGGFCVSTIAPTLAAPEADTPLQSVSPRFILAIYAVIPLALLFIAVDYLLFDFRLNALLPNTPADMGWLNVFFMLPHVVASVLTFADREYLVSYSGRLVGSSLAFVAGIVLVPALFGVAMMVLLLALYTAYHQVAQQTGIASIVARHRSPLNTAWKWLCMVVLVAVFLASLVEADLRQKMYAAAPLLYVTLISAVFGALVVVGALVARQSRTTTGRLLVGANTGMILMQGVFFALGLHFFMILIPRLVHDITAFGFYITHNMNRNRGVPHNVVVRAFQPTRLPEYLLTPAIALGVSVALSQLVPREFLVFIVAFLALFHYYWEGVMWKNGAPHRQFIRV